MKKLHKFSLALVLFIFANTVYADPVYVGSVIEGGYLFNMPFDIAVTADGSKGYVSSRSNGVVLIVDLSAGDPYVSGQIAIPGSGTKQASAMACNPALNELYVIDPYQNALFVIDTTNNTIGAQSISVASTPQNVTVSPAGDKIYVCTSGNDTVHVINATTRQVETSISLNVDADPFGMAVANQKLYVAGTYSAKVYVIDLNPQSTTYHTVIKSIPAGIGVYGAISHPDQTYVYISHDTIDGKVSVIDTGADTVVTTIAIKNNGESSNKNPKGMAISDSILYVVNNADSTISLIDTSANTKLLTDRIINSGGNGPVSLVSSPDGTKLYIVHSSVGSVEIINIEHPVQYKLTVNKAGTCMGTVSSLDSGINCGENCSRVYDRNASVTLSAQPDDSCTFSGWNGGGCIGNGDCTVTMNQDFTVTASFINTPTYQLTVQLNSGRVSGTVTTSSFDIDCGLLCQANYDENTTVKLTATPAKCYRLDAWSGAGCSGSDNECQIVMDGNKLVAVSFTRLPSSVLSIETTGMATGTVASDDIDTPINCGGDCIKVYDNCETVTLTATPSPDFEFTGWEGGGCAGTDVCIVEMTEDKSVKANFERVIADKSRAIIVAGGGPTDNNFLWEQTRLVADYAFRTLMCQQIPRENIYYLTESDRLVSDCSGNQYAPNDAPTINNLKAAFNWVTEDTTKLVLYMVDHGGENTFRMSENELLKADSSDNENDLDGILDSLQSRIAGPVIVVYDACQSGSFIPKMSKPVDSERIMITSASSDENAWFLKDGRVSFSFRFWTTVFEGAPLNHVFTFAADTMAKYQTAQVDANGDGVSEGNEAKYLSQIYIGNALANGQPPEIRAVRENLTLDGETTANLWAGNIFSEKAITEVWAEIVTPCFQSGDPHLPVTDLESKTLSGPDAEGKYSGEYEFFNQTGEYLINIYAMNVDSSISIPASFTVTQLSGTSCRTYTGDANGDGKTDLEDVITLLKVLSGAEATLSNNAIASSDIDDDKLGISDVVYLLQNIAEIR